METSGFAAISSEFWENPGEIDISDETSLGNFEPRLSTKWGFFGDKWIDQDSPGIRGIPGEFDIFDGAAFRTLPANLLLIKINIFYNIIIYL